MRDPGFGTQEDRQRQSAARLAGAGVIVLVAASVLLVYLHLRRSKQEVILSLEKRPSQRSSKAKF